MKSKISIQLLLLKNLSLLPVPQHFDFFYFVLQWPGSYCNIDTATTGKPEPDFGIHGLWRAYNDGSYPVYCDPNNPFKESEPKTEINMKYKVSILIQLVLLQYLSVVSVSQDFDFFYFVLQWPGSYCDTQQSCCYPKTGKPEADFGIHGLWPNYNDGSYPSNCDPNNPFQQSQVSGLISNLQRNWPTLACPSGNGIQFWSHEWDKHGTCSESVLPQHDYFASALNLKQQANLLQALSNSGIEADGGSYSLSSIEDVIKGSTGFGPFIECNEDSSGNSQLYQVYLCVDTSASNFIDCPVFPNSKCPSQIHFPSF